MNKVILMGRLTKEVDLRQTQDGSTQIARYTLAVERMQKDKDGNRICDFINCVAFNKMGEFASKYFHKGQRVLVEGSIQLGSYTNKEGKQVYTTDIIVHSQEFADGKVASNEGTKEQELMAGFEEIPQATEDDELPFV